jgi:hypothetical protein
LCVNVAAGGPIVAAWLDWRGRTGDEAAVKAAKYLARWSVTALLVGAALGVLLGWLRWNAAYRSLWLGPLRYKLDWAVVEAVFSLVLMIGWWFRLPGTGGGSSVAAVARGMVAILAATNLLYHFPSLFAVATHLYDSGQISGPEIDGRAFRQFMTAGLTPSLWLHVSLASLAAAGMMLLLMAWRLRREGQHARAARVAVWGGRWALVPSLAQIPTGLWALAALSPTQQSTIMGSDAAATLLFILAILAAVWLLNDLAKLALADTQPSLPLRAAAAMVMTIVLMTAMESML